ncbi:MAG: EamA family transporter [Eubacteriales bacterium]|nr:EamA family transporter [Eubacteriales bacterium]
MWFLPAVICLLLWSGSDVFSKIGCVDQKKDPYAPLKMVVAVGLVMGVHAIYSLLAKDIGFSWSDIVRYLPVSLLYIISMAIGYLGLRYIELSISSPICNASGAVVLLIYLFKGEPLEGLAALALILVILGVLGLGVVEYREDPEKRKLRQEEANRYYAKSLLAILLPILYMIIDALGTYADSIILETMPEEVANTAYELTFLTCGIVVFIYLLASGKFTFLKKEDSAKLVGALFETGGQFAYVFALSANAMYAAPVISSYCVVSVVWSRIFLKEKLSAWHYLTIACAVAGIVILGILDV